MEGFPRVGFPRALLTNPSIVVGDETYSDDPAGPEHFEV
jgi:virginiamycin A acetyltransferase